MHAFQRKDMVHELLQLFAAVSDVNDYSVSITCTTLPIPWNHVHHSPPCQRF